MQLLVHLKGASLYQDLPWPQRRLVVTIRVNTVTSLSRCHICFLSSVVESNAFSCTQSRWITSLLPHFHFHHKNPQPIFICFVHVCVHFQQSTLTPPSVVLLPEESSFLLISFTPLFHFVCHFSLQVLFFFTNLLYHSLSSLCLGTSFKCGII